MDLSIIIFVPSSELFFDCLMPDYTKNKTELLHGNSNKFLSLIVMTLKTIF